MDDRDLDNRLSQRLRAYESRLPETDAPDPRDIRSRGGLRWPALAGVLGAAAVIGVVLGALILDRPGGLTGQATDTPSATEQVVGESPTADPSPSPESTGSPSTSPPPTTPPLLEIAFHSGTDDTIQSVQGIATRGDVLVAAVNVHQGSSIEPVGPSTYNGAIYVQRGTSEWDPVDTGEQFAGHEFTHLTTAPDGRFVLYSTPMTATAEDGNPEYRWISEDGLTWTSIEPAGGQIAQGPLGSIMATTRRDGDSFVAEIYFSVDAIDWELAYESPPVADLIIDATGAGPEGFVVAMRSRDQLTSPVEAFTRASSDGRSWVTSPPSGAGPEVFSTVAPIGPDWVAATFAQVSPELDAPTSGSMAVWWSANGLDWEPVAQIDDPYGRERFGAPSYLVSTGERLFLSATLLAEGVESRPMGVFSSTDGRIWSMVDLGTEAEVRTARTNGSHLLLGGRAGADALAWRVSPEFLPN